MSRRCWRGQRRRGTSETAVPLSRSCCGWGFASGLLGDPQAPNIPFEASFPSLENLMDQHERKHPRDGSQVDANDGWQQLCVAGMSEHCADAPSRPCPAP